MKKKTLSFRDYLFICMALIVAGGGIFLGEYYENDYSIGALGAAVLIAAAWFLSEAFQMRGWGQKILDFLSDKCDECRAVLDAAQTKSVDQLSDDYLLLHLTCPTCGASLTRIVPALK